MPILVKDFSYEDTPEVLYITLPLRSTAPSKVDVRCTPFYLKINYAPFFYELDLAHEINVQECVSKIGDGLVCVELHKADPKEWLNIKFIGTRDVIMARREDSEKMEFTRIEAVYLCST